MNPISSLFAGAILSILLVCASAGISSADQGSPPLNQWYEKTAKEVASGKPLVMTHYVALCDNQTQGIVPVPKSPGDGDNPDTNLYWGAAFGY